jgi:hypothetical protein
MTLEIIISIILFTITLLFSITIYAYKSDYKHLEYRISQIEKQQD